MSGGGPRCWAVMPAAGSGQRMGAALPKQYLPLAGRTVLEHSLAALLDHPLVDAAVLVLDPADRHWRALGWRPAKPVWITAGGTERYLSVLNGLRALAERAPAERARPDDWVLVHDAARPCLHPADLDTLLRELWDDAVGGLLASKISDTVKRADSLGQVAATLPREQLWQAQTPQMFRFQVLSDALEQARAEGRPVTDEAAALERLQLAPRLVEGRRDNIKITRPEDLPLAEYFLARRASAVAAATAGNGPRRQVVC